MARCFVKEAGHPMPVKFRADKLARGERPVKLWVHEDWSEYEFKDGYRMPAPRFRTLAHCLDPRTRFVEVPAYSVKWDGEILF